MRKTGAIWNRSPRSRGQTVRRVCERLEDAYGQPRHGNPEEPVSDLVYVLLSNRTPQSRAQRVYETFRKSFPEWPDVLEASKEEVVQLLRPAGFANRRSDQIRSILGRLKEDFGAFESAALWEWQTGELLEYLTSLRGVSDKVARCVLIVCSQPRRSTR